MDETELALYGEFLEMCKSGCNFDQIAQLMGEETCRAVLAAMKPADDEYKRLIGYSDDQGL